MTTSQATYRLGYERIVAWIQSIIDALLTQAADDTAESAGQLEFATARATHLFAQAIHEASNLELDWLWYAANMVDDIERRYCLNRALAIDPHSSLARKALAKLPKPAQVTGQAAPRSRAAGASKHT